MKDFFFIINHIFYYYLSNILNQLLKSILILSKINNICCTKLHHLMSYTNIKEVLIEEGVISSINLSYNRKYLIVCTTNGHMYIYDFKSDFKLINEKTVHERGINDIKFSEDDKYLITCSDDRTVRIMDAETWTHLRTLYGHKSSVFAIDTLHNMYRIVSGSRDTTFRIWDPRYSKPIETVGAHSEPLSDVCFSYDGYSLLSSSFDGLVRIWDTDTYILQHSFKTDGYPISRSYFSPNSEFFVTTSIDNKINMFSLNSGHVIKTYQGANFNDYIPDSGFIERGSGEIFCSSDGCIIGWDINTMEKIWTIPTFPFPYVAFSPQSGDFLFVGKDKSLKIYMFVQ